MAENRVDPDAIGTHRDERGTLVAAELGRLPFPVARVFAVTGVVGGSQRGNHLVPCPQLIVLVSGVVEVSFGPDADHLGSTVSLTNPGETVLLGVGDFVRYHLRDAGSTIFVLAQDEYRDGISAS